MDVFECTHKGVMKIGEREIACAVLSNGTRIITQTALFDAFDRPRKGEKRQDNLPSIIGAKNLLPFIPEDFAEKAYPIHYYLDNGNIAAGYNAIIIPEICEIYLKARDAGNVLHSSQENMVREAESLIRALAKVGITALIDEATGYQYERESNALQEILKAYIAEDFLKWQSRFPRKFYQEVFRIHGWEYDPMSFNRPGYLGKFTNKYVYEKLPEGVLDELKKKNPKQINGHRRRRHHQHLTPEIGIPHLEKHLTKLITIMELSDSADEFRRNFNKVFEKIDQQVIDLGL